MSTQLYMLVPHCCTWSYHTAVHGRTTLLYMLMPHCCTCSCHTAVHAHTTLLYMLIPHCCTCSYHTAVHARTTLLYIHKLFCCTYAHTYICTYICTYIRTYTYSTYTSVLYTTQDGQVFELTASPAARGGVILYAMMKLKKLVETETLKPVSPL